MNQFFGQPIHCGHRHKFGDNDLFFPCSIKSVS